MDSNPIALFQLLKADLSLLFPGTYSELCSLSPENIGNYEPPIGCTPREFACVALLKSILKKYQDGDRPSKIAEATAIQKFLESNERCEAWEEPSDRDEISEIFLNEMSYTMYTIFDGVSEFYLTPDSIFRNFGCGPGASVKVSGNTFYHKMCAGPVSCTDSLLYRLYRYASRGSLWEVAEKSRSSVFGDPVIVPGSSLSCVPKTSDVARVICTEPSLNMNFQLGIGSIVAQALLHHFRIDLSDQPEKNKALAQRGSIDNSYCTIDLSSASDSIALKFLERILPGTFLNWLKLTRSPVTTLPSGYVVPLHMVSSMGNGFTFPLQTLIFTALVTTCYKLLGIKVEFNQGSIPGNFGVFGDDIICLKKAYPLVTKMLKLCGFILNDSKTFCDGPFRESCGGDFHYGMPVRGVYCRSLESIQDRLSLINRLTRWSANMDINIDWTIKYLLNTIPKRKLLLVPPYEDDCAGLHVPLGLVKVTPHYKVLNEDVGAVYKYFAYEPDLKKIYLKDSSFSSKHLHYNPGGVVLTAVGGFLRGGALGVSLRRARFGVVPRLCPGWGPGAVARGRFVPGGSGRWSALAFRLFFLRFAP